MLRGALLLLGLPCNVASVASPVWSSPANTDTPTSVDVPHECRLRPDAGDRAAQRRCLV